MYGNPDELPVTELTPPVPINPYGQSKLMAEEVGTNAVAVSHYHKTRQVLLTGLKEVTVGLWGSQSVSPSSWRRRWLMQLQVSGVGSKGMSAQLHGKLGLVRATLGRGAPSHTRRVILATQSRRCPSIRKHQKAGGGRHGGESGVVGAASGGSKLMAVKLYDYVI